MTIKQFSQLAILPYASIVFCSAQATSLPQADTLARVFTQMHSADPATVEAARSSLIDVFKQDLPHIEQYKDVICGALNDPDPIIRLQATGILSVIVQLAPEHAPLITACNPNLLVTATDTEDRVRNNALFALVMNPNGPPAGAYDLLSKAMASDNFRTSQLGAVGVLRLGDETAVLNALKGTVDPKQQLNLLYAIGGAQKKSNVLFEAVQHLAYSDTADLQLASIDALVATSSNPAQAIKVLNSIVSARSTTPNTRAYAETALRRLHDQP